MNSGEKSSNIGDPLSSLRTLRSHHHKWLYFPHIPPAKSRGLIYHNPWDCEYPTLHLTEHPPSGSRQKKKKTGLNRVSKVHKNDWTWTLLILGKQVVHFHFHFYTFQRHYLINCEMKMMAHRSVPPRLNSEWNQHNRRVEGAHDSGAVHACVSLWGRGELSEMRCKGEQAAVKIHRGETVWPILKLLMRV